MELLLNKPIRGLVTPNNCATLICEVAVLHRLANREYKQATPYLAASRECERNSRYATSFLRDQKSDNKYVTALR